MSEYCANLVRLSSECHDPICFPIFSPIVRECLFKMARVRLDVGETVAVQDDFSLEFFLIVELALAMGKPANRGRSYDAVSAVCP